MNVAIVGGMREVGKSRGAPLAIVEVDAELVVCEWNDRAEQVFAVSRERALGRPLAELVPLHDGAWHDALAGDDPGPRRLVVDHPAGAQHLEAWVQREPGGITLYAHDITARAAVERRQALVATLYDAVKSNLDIALWAIDRQGNFLLGEGKAVLAAGNKENQFVGLNVFQLFGDTPEAREALAGKLQHSPPGESFGIWWESWYVPVDDPRSGAAVVSISLDVTQAKRREDELLSKLDLIERQRETIRELSTPIIEVWDGVLTLPIIGLVDSVRTAELMDDLLQAITRTRSRFAILDLTGVQVVDTSTASHLIGLIQAIRLLGAEGVLTGIHPNIAQTIVGLGVDLARVRVFATLRDALKHCIASMPRRT